MARPRNTAADAIEIPAAISDGSEPARLDAGEAVVVPPPATPRAAAAVGDAPMLPALPLAPPVQPAQPAGGATPPTRPGLVRISKAGQIRQVHPVDVADWIALGWTVSPAGQPDL
jgi:hypothetical protein